MRVVLLVSEYCPTCPRAEQVWQVVHGERQFDFEVVDVGQPEGRRLLADNLIKTIPATLIDGQLAHVGVPDMDRARELVQCAPPRAQGEVPAEAASMTMQRFPRHLVRSAMAYAVLGALPLLDGGDLLGRGQGILHLFTAGFVAFLILGVAEHMLPRFTGHPVRSGWSQWLQGSLLHLGVWGLAVGLVWPHRPLATVGAVLLWTGLVTAAARLGPLVLRPSVGEQSQLG
jgi:glutaredoxin